MNKRKWSAGICIILLTALYIWSNSLQSGAVSNEQSKMVLEIIEDVFRTPSLDTQEAQHIVRKAAHVMEFALLGLEMAVLLLLTGKMRGQNIVNALFAGLAAAVVDESIQAFTLRGSQVIDLWFDLAGVLMGIGIGLIAYMLLHKARMQKAIRKPLAMAHEPACPSDSAGKHSGPAGKEMEKVKKVGWI